MAASTSWLNELGRRVWATDFGTGQPPTGVGSRAGSTSWAGFAKTGLDWIGLAVDWLGLHWLGRRAGSTSSGNGFWSWPATDWN